MQLRSYDGASVELRIAGYEFPDYKVRSADVAVRWLQALDVAQALPSAFPRADAKKLARDWDANWLQVCGDVTLVDRRAWVFEEPCLMTWEARELGSWLGEVAAGGVPPSPVGDGEPGQLLEFTELNIAFSL